MCDMPNLEIVKIEEVVDPQGSVLRKTALQVSFPLCQADQVLIQQMKEMLEKIGGVGLAAPQVGANKAIAVIKISEDAAFMRFDGEGAARPMHTLINPHYQGFTEDRIKDVEACFSVGTKAGEIPRFSEIDLEYQDESGGLHQEKVTGFYARVLQHEIDHLEGILIIDRLTDDCAQGTLPEMQALRRSRLSPEKLAIYDKIMQQINHGKDNLVREKSGQE